MKRNHNKALQYIHSITVSFKITVGHRPCRSSTVQFYVPVKFLPAGLSVYSVNNYAVFQKRYSVYFRGMYSQTRKQNSEFTVKKCSINVVFIES